MRGDGPAGAGGLRACCAPAGIYVVRKTKQEVIEMITAWAALEAMAARLITQTAQDDGTSLPAANVLTFEDGKQSARSGGRYLK